MRFIFYDYETFGIDVARDRIAQFAAVITDENFTIIDEPIMLYCKQYWDYLPKAQAILLTKITPQQCNEQGLDEAEFARTIHEIFSLPESCILGYNNIRFDDELTRYLFYRNFFDPYEYSYHNGNSRWDLLDVLRACYALRPEGIKWVHDEHHNPVFRLSSLAKANGIYHEQAHDALADVYATIELAKLLKKAQPKLFSYFFHHRQTKMLKQRFDSAFFEPLVHVSGMLGAYRAHSSLVCPLIYHPKMAHSMVVCDLDADISPLLDEGANTLYERLYSERAFLTQQQITPVPLKLVHLNKSPILAPAATLSPARAKEIGIDFERAMNNVQILRENRPLICKKISELFSIERTFERGDVQTELYRQFFSPQDKQSMSIVRNLKPEQMRAHQLIFDDERIEPLLFYFRAKNYPHSLSDAEHKSWLAYCKERFAQQAAAFTAELEQLCHEHYDDEQKMTLLSKAADYYSSLNAQLNSDKAKKLKKPTAYQHDSEKLDHIVEQCVSKEEKFAALKDLLGGVKH